MKGRKMEEYISFTREQLIQLIGFALKEDQEAAIDVLVDCGLPSLEARNVYYAAS